MFSGQDKIGLGVYSHGLVPESQKQIAFHAHNPEIALPFPVRPHHRSSQVTCIRQMLNH